MSKLFSGLKAIVCVAAALMCGGVWAEVTPYTHYTFNDLDVGDVPSNNETTFKNTGTNTGGAFAMTTGSIVAVDENGNKAWVFGAASKAINSAPNASVSPTTYVTTFSFNGASFSDWKIIWGTNGQAYNGPAFCVKGNATDGYQVAIIRHATGAIKTENTYLTYDVPQTLTGYHMWALTMVYEGNAGVYTLYCDGEQISTTSAGGYWGNQNSMFGLGQGGNKDTPITPEGLAIDDLQIYNKVLSIKEIQDLAGIETGKLKMNDKWYDTIAAALDDVQEGENIITLYAQIAENVTLPANVTVEATSDYKITGTISGSGTYSIALAQSNSKAGINSLFTSEQLAGFKGTVLMTKGRFEFNTAHVSLVPSAVTLATSNQGKIYLGSGEWNNHFVIAGNGWTGDGDYNMGPVAMRIDGATFGADASIQAVVENSVVPAIGIYNTNPTLCAITGNGGVRLRSHNAQTITITAANLNGLSGTINLVDTNLTLAIDISEGSATVANEISGSGTLKKIGIGNLTLSGENENMNGPITVAAGTLTVGNYKALGPYTANQTRAITVESGATLNNQNHDMTGRKLVISGTGSGSNGAAYITTGNGSQMREFRDGTIILADDATIKIDNGRGIKTQYMEYVFGGHTLTKIGSADLTMRNNWTADTDSGRFVITEGAIAFDTVGVRFGAIDMTVGENGTIKRNLANNTLAVKSLTLESGATISDSKTAISVAGALTVGETIKLPNATEGMVVMTVAGDKPTTLPSIADSELALAFDGNDLKVVAATTPLKPGVSTDPQETEPTEEELARYEPVAVNDEAAAAGQAAILKVVKKQLENGKWVITVDLDETKMQIEDTAVAFASIGLVNIAGSTTAQQISIPATAVTPGAYYSVIYGDSPTALSSEGMRALATSAGVKIAIPAMTGKKVQFFRVKASANPKAN